MTALNECLRRHCHHEREDHDDVEGCRRMLTRYGFGAPDEGRLEQCECPAYADDMRDER